MEYLRRLMRHNDAGIALSAGLLFVGCALSSESFLSAYNLFNISRIVAFSVLVALAQAVVLVAGGMNLSVGAVGGLATITTGYCIQVLGLPGWLAALVALGIGGVAGWVNGVIITRLQINSFIATLATLFVFTGLVHGFSEGYAYTDIPSGIHVSWDGRSFWGCRICSGRWGWCCWRRTMHSGTRSLGGGCWRPGGIRRRLGWRGSIPTG